MNGTGTLNFRFSGLAFLSIPTALISKDEIASPKLSSYLASQNITIQLWVWPRTNYFSLLMLYVHLRIIQAQPINQDLGKEYSPQWLKGGKPWNTFLGWFLTKQVSYFPGYMEKMRKVVLTICCEWESPRCSSTAYSQALCPDILIC